MGLDVIFVLDDIRARIGRERFEDLDLCEDALVIEISLGAPLVALAGEDLPR